MRVASRLAFVVFMSCMCFSVLRVLCVRVYVLVCVCTCLCMCGCSSWIFCVSSGVGCFTLCVLVSVGFVFSLCSVCTVYVRDVLCFVRSVVFRVSSGCAFSLCAFSNLFCV